MFLPKAKSTCWPNFKMCTLKKIRAGSVSGKDKETHQNPLMYLLKGQLVFSGVELGVGQLTTPPNFYATGAIPFLLKNARFEEKLYFWGKYNIFP